MRYLAPGKLDYGNSPRATPLINGDRAFLLGAFGHLTCVDVTSGRVLWRLSLRDEFDATAKLPWGYCGSPLLVDGKLVVNPGGAEASLVGLDASTGEPAWQTAGPPPGYGSLIVAELGCIRQIVGHDADSLGGWDPATGRRLWKVVPERANDFNVPTPLVHKGRLIVATENNGLRAFDFDDQGQIVSKPSAINEEVLPDTQTPVVIDNRLFVSFQGLYCFDLNEPWKVLWKGEDPAFEQHASLIASRDRLLILSHEAELLLIDAHADALRILGRCRLIGEESGLLAHPALVDRRLYVRTNDELLCVDLEP